MPNTNAGTNAVGVSYTKETGSWGATPAANLLQLRYAGESLGQETQTTTSNEIRSDRNVADVIRTGVNASGSVNGELSYGAIDGLLEGGMMSTFSAAIAGSVTASVVASGNKYVRGSGSWVTDGYQVGMNVKVAGYGIAGNNGVATVVSRTTTDLVVSGLTLADEAATACTFKNSGMIRNGVTFTSFSFEKAFTDLTNIFLALRGMCVGTGTFNIATGGINTFDLGFTGRSMEDATATIGTGYTAAPTNDVLNAIDNVTAIREGGTITTLDVSELSVGFNNNLRAQMAIGSAFAIGIGLGEFGADGSIKAYFSSLALLNKYLDYTPTSLSFRLIDAAGNMLIVTLPRVKFTNGQVVVQGKNGDVMADMSYTAMYDSTTGCTMQFDRIAA